MLGDSEAEGVNAGVEVAVRDSVTAAVLEEVPVVVEVEEAPKEEEAAAVLEALSV